MSIATSPVMLRAEELFPKLGFPITTGIATQYWLELVSLPPGNNNRLWLFVNNTWTHLATHRTGSKTLFKMLSMPGATWK